MGACPSNSPEFEELIRRYSELSPQAVGIGGQSHTGAHLCFYGCGNLFQSMQFVETVQKYCHPAAVSCSQLQLLGRFTGSAENNLSGVKIEGHLQLQTAGHIQSES